MRINLNTLISCTVALAAVLVAALWWLPSSEPTARPLFHEAARDGGSKWRRADSITDYEGVWAWVDEPANLTIVVITGEKERSRTNALQVFGSTVTVKIGANDSSLFMTIHDDLKTPNQLLLIMPDGRA